MQIFSFISFFLDSSDFASTQALFPLAFTSPSTLPKTSSLFLSFLLSCCYWFSLSLLLLSSKCFRTPSVRPGLTVLSQYSAWYLSGHNSVTWSVALYNLIISPQSDFSLWIVLWKNLHFCASKCQNTVIKFVMYFKCLHFMNEPI